MAARRALLIGPLLLALGGWAGAGQQRTPEAVCGGCHAPHFVGRGTCASCHRGDPTALRQEIAHQRLLCGPAADHARSDSSAVSEGRRLVERLACRRCHVVGAAGNGLATDLDRIAWKREQSLLERSISSPVENMPRFGLETRQVVTVLAYLLHGADLEGAQTSYRVRFSSRGERSGSVFDERCGGCHRALTVAGPLGRGSSGPNLAGLSSAHYPGAAPGGGAWTAETLGAWLQNPRAHRPLAAMRPVKLSAERERELRAELGAAPVPRFPIEDPSRRGSPEATNTDRSGPDSPPSLVPVRAPFGRR